MGGRSYSDQSNPLTRRSFSSPLRARPRPSSVSLAVQEGPPLDLLAWHSSGESLPLQLSDAYEPQLTHPTPLTTLGAFGYSGLASPSSINSLRTRDDTYTVLLSTPSCNVPAPRRYWGREENLPVPMDQLRGHADPPWGEGRPPPNKAPGRTRKAFHSRYTILSGAVLRVWNFVN